MLQFRCSKWKKGGSLRALLRLDSWGRSLRPVSRLDARSGTEWDCGTECFQLGSAAGNGYCAGPRCRRVFPELPRVSQSRQGHGAWGGERGGVGDVSEAYRRLRGGVQTERGGHSQELSSFKSIFPIYSVDYRLPPSNPLASFL